MKIVPKILEIPSYTPWNALNCVSQKVEETFSKRLFPFLCNIKSIPLGKYQILPIGKKVECIVNKVRLQNSAIQFISVI